ncbi:MAG: hypothetical protein ACPK85_01875 [Methanosarcina sp.]
MNNYENRLFNIIFLSIFCIIIYSLPYVISEYYRFPDTFSVVKNSLLVEDIISGKIYSVYPQSYPASYLFFNILNKITNTNLFFFSRLIWSPFVLIGFITLWYLFVEKLFNSKAALVVCMLSIPTQIIEITSSPNSFGIMLVMTALLLCTYKNSKFKFLLLITLITCVTAHPVSFVVIVIFFSFFYIFSFLPNPFLKVSFNILLLVIVLWFFWTLFTAGMGDGIIVAIYKTLTFESKSIEHLTTYTVSSGDLIYPWIQKYNTYKYELYALLACFIFVLDISNIRKNNVNIINSAYYSKRFMFLAISFILLSLTLINLTFGGADTENVISRTLNYSMLAICTYLGSSYRFFPISAGISVEKSIGCKSFKIDELRNPYQRRIPLTGLCLIFFLIVVSTTYPTYSYARDSYINYPISEKYGDEFFCKHEYESNLIKDSNSFYFYDLMKEKYATGQIDLQHNLIYKNGWYSIESS